MASPLGILLVVVGILLAVAGGTLWTISHESYDNCQDDLFRAVHNNDCQEAVGEYEVGIAGLIGALVLTVIGIVLLASGEPKSLHSQFTCARCRALLTYQDSPTNCYNCGLPIDWSKGSSA